MVPASVNVDRVPHMADSGADAADQRARNARIAAQKLHAAGVTLADHVSVCKRPVGGKGLPHAGILRGSGIVAAVFYDVIVQIFFPVELAQPRRQSTHDRLDLVIHRLDRRVAVLQRQIGIHLQQGLIAAVTVGVSVTKPENLWVIVGIGHDGFFHLSLRQRL